MALILRALALCSLVVLAACTSQTPSPSPSATPAGTPAATTSVATSPAGNWRLSELAGKPPVGENPVTAIITESGSVSGSGGCNRYGADFAIDGSSLKLTSPPRSTMMACAEDVMAQEAAFFAVLEKATTFAVVDENLQLKDESGAVLAAFSAVKQELAGTTWKLTGFNDGSALRSPVVGTDLRLEFSAEGQLSVTGGCNTLGSSFSTENRIFTAGPVVSTMMACESPEGVMDQENALRKAIESATSYVIEGDQLTLRQGDTMALTASRA